jgi:hypothetical protein
MIGTFSNAARVAAVLLCLFARDAVARTIQNRLDEFGAAADGRWKPLFSRAHAAYPPREIVLVGLKRERQLAVYAPGTSGLVLVRSLPMLAASGGPGPKLREGDGQVPEGFYAIESLNPNSRYHVSLRVNYPNAEDKAHGRSEGRSRLGGDIMIHGSAVSIGCLAMGDEAAEDLFTLAARCGLKNIRVLLVPGDFRKGPIAVPKDAPAWTGPLYERLEAELAKLPSGV